MRKDEVRLRFMGRNIYLYWRKYTALLGYKDDGVYDVFIWKDGQVECVFHSFNNKRAVDTVIEWIDGRRGVNDGQGADKKT